MRLSHLFSAAAVALALAGLAPAWAQMAGWVWEFPATASYTAAAGDNGKALSPQNVPDGGATMTRTSQILNGLLGTAAGESWSFLTSTAYSATLADNGHTLSNALAGAATTVTLPSTGLLPNGWTLGLYANGSVLTAQVDSISGGNITSLAGFPTANFTLPTQGYAQLQFGGANFRDITNSAPVYDFGTTSSATAAATTAALNTAIAAAIAAGSPVLSLAANGTFNIATTGVNAEDGLRTSIKIASARNFTLDCRGSTLVMNTGARSTFSKSLWITGSKNVTVRNCRFDWLQLPYTQATLTAINATTADFTIDAAYPVVGWTTVQQIEEFTPSTIANVPAAWVKYIFSVGGGNRALTSLGSNVYRVDFSTGADLAALALLTVGHSYLITAQNYGAEAIWAYDVDGLTIDNVQCFTVAGECFRSWGGSDINVVNGTGARLPPGSTRWRSVTSSAIFPGFTRGLLNIKNPIDQSGGDDGIDVYGLTYPINTVTDLKHFVLGAIQIPGYTPLAGDTLQFLDTTGQSKGTAIVSTVTGTGPYTVVTSTNAPAGLATTWIAADVSAIPAHLLVSGGQFDHLRGSAVKSNAQSSLIQENYFGHLSGSAVLIDSMISLFPEGPIAKNITIANNVSEHNNLVGNPADFSVIAYSLDGTIDAPAGTIDGVTITGNVCRNTTNMCVFVNGAKNVTVTGNSFQNWATNASNFWHGLGYYAVGVSSSASVQVDPNTYLSAGKRLGTYGSTRAAGPAIFPINPFKSRTIGGVH